MLQMEYNRDLDLTQAGKAEGIAEGIAIGQANMLTAMEQFINKGLSLEQTFKILSRQTQQPGSAAPA